MRSAIVAQNGDLRLVGLGGVPGDHQVCVTVAIEVARVDAVQPLADPDEALGGERAVTGAGEVRAPDLGANSSDQRGRDLGNCPTVLRPPVSGRDAALRRCGGRVRRASAGHRPCRRPAARASSVVSGATDGSYRP